jgi:uncharacterized protein YceH (UPF0502 family)
MDLSSSEIRVLGCLLEKQRTTPDQYPLTLNALRLACNQSTNREPVLNYDDAVIRDALHRLERRGFVRLAGASRAAKYRHLLSEALPMSAGEQAVMCVLMLRGPQTPGELKQRSERMHPFAGLDGVHETLGALIGRALVAQLERRPGQKEERYTQLLGEDVATNAGVDTAEPTRSVAGDTVLGGTPSVSANPDLSERVRRLEAEVEMLRSALRELRGEVSVGYKSGGGHVTMGDPELPTGQTSTTDEAPSRDEAPADSEAPIGHEAPINDAPANDAPADSETPTANISEAVVRAETGWFEGMPQHTQ